MFTCLKPIACMALLFSLTGCLWGFTQSRSGWDTITSDVIACNSNPRCKNAQDKPASEKTAGEKPASEKPKGDEDAI